MKHSASGPSSSNQIVIAIIGVAGSLGVAWITTGAKFEQQLRANETTVMTLKAEVTQLKESFKSLASQREAATQQLSLLRASLDAAGGQARDLQTQLAATHAQADAVDARLVALSSRTPAVKPPNFSAR